MMVEDQDDGEGQDKARDQAKKTRIVPISLRA